ncbi:GntR family transcriptional regulator [Ensifer sp. ENS05]|uniref:GntR family transcriptional regulator n=1 Tax=Ensifer sp. ENS05 TaxID=2769277 RepID=UPI0017824927|nr:GntR family transcriptional regulator [Ensifer sp. ENS05]MBD9597408.1 GntR family transcriptional regulator [Ensifer sp. ENS05]
MAKSAKSDSGTKSSGEKQSLVQQAYEQIKEKVITLHFLPGQYLSEGAICEQLQLGRTPVHQALQRLHLEGLVDVLPRKGIIVQPDSIAEIVRILDSRLTVEPELARLAAQRVRDGELKEKDLARLMRAANATDPVLQPPDLSNFTSNDREFHREIALLSGNPIMGDFARVLHERSTRFWYLHLWQTIDVPLTNTQHEAIAKAIASGDPETAGSQMQAHIKALRERLLRVQSLSPLQRGAPSA